MPGELFVRPKAREDIVEQALYIAEDSPRAANRFLDTVWNTFDLLLATPAMGALRTFDNPALIGVRMWPVKGFDKRLIFYRPVEGGVEIIRVLHATRDIGALLEEPE